MLFNSWQFALFLPIVVILYWLLPAKRRWLLLFVSSYYFYMSWNVKYVVLILFTTAVSYCAALLIENVETQKKKKFCLSLAFIASLGVLVVFKYLDFLFESFNFIASAIAIPLSPIALKLILPVGISFYTFQTLSYVVDVYRGEAEAERNFGIYATFISFFPQLVAGPIERTGNLLPQIRAEHSFDYSQSVYGLKLMAWGYFKKMVIADNLAVFVDLVFNEVFYYSGFSLVLATLFFAVQIYCDFSGYSDIARGCAKLMGIELMENFRSPYFSTSVKEFWSRWHISLSTWFRDYLYIPLGGNRCSKARTFFNLFFTFLVSGLWHGANWTFVLWGAVHGLAQIIEKVLGINSSKESGIKKLLRCLPVFAFVYFAWIFFRAGSLFEALHVIRSMFIGILSPLSYFRAGFKAIGFGKRELVVSLLFYFLPLALYDYASLSEDVISRISKLKPFARWAVYTVFCSGIIILFYVSLNPSFIYFKF